MIPSNAGEKIKTIQGTELAWSDFPYVIHNQTLKG